MDSCGVSSRYRYKRRSLGTYPVSNRGFWEDINFNGKNNKKSYLYNKTSYNKETNQYTTIKEIRKK